MMAIFRKMVLVGSVLGAVLIFTAMMTEDWAYVCKWGPEYTCVLKGTVLTEGIWGLCVYETDNSSVRKCFYRHHDPTYMWVSKHLMIWSSIFSLMALLVVLLVTVAFWRPGFLSTYFQDWKCTVAGGVLMIIAGLCGLTATVWYPVAVYKNGHLIKICAGLWLGWVGVALSLLAGCIQIGVDFWERFRPRQQADICRPTIVGPIELLDQPYVCPNRAGDADV